MAWVRIDDHFPDHPKIVSAGSMAAYLYVAGLCYCNRLLTNGFIPMSQVDRLVPAGETDNSQLFRKKLCELGLWSEGKRKGIQGFLVHDYLKYQPSKAQIIKKRAESAARVGRFRNAAVTPLHAANNGVGNALCNAAPTPTPTPTPTKKKEQIPSSADADFAVLLEAYPRNRRIGGKVGKAAFQRAGIGRHGDSLATVLLALEQQKHSEQWQTPKLIPLMTTWLNQNRWLQELPAAGAGNGVTRTADVKTYAEIQAEHYRQHVTNHES